MQNGILNNTNLNSNIMKEFLDIMAKDLMNENFTRKECLEYGVIAPIALVLTCMLASIF
jgi:hypothetical protein